MNRQLTIKATCIALACVPLALTGCGGGGGGSTAGSGGSGDGGGGGTNPSAPANVTATFKVHLATGKVEITSGQGQATAAGDLHKSVVLSGSALTFNSSTVIDVGGSPGYKALNVSMINNYGLTLGLDPNGNLNGLKVVFGPITNLATPPVISGQTAVSTFAGTGTAGLINGPASGAQFRKPNGVVVSNGVTYVVDTTNNLIRTIANNQVGVLAGGKAGDVDGIGSAAGFSGPAMIAVNPVDGALIVTEQTSHKVRRVTTDGRVTTIAGTGSAGGANGVGTAATFNAPTGVAVDPMGNIFVSEYSGFRIREITLGAGLSPTSAASYTVSTFAGSGIAGTADGIGTAASFDFPAGIALAPDGTLYVCDTAVSAIRRVSPAGEVVRIIGAAGSGNVDGLGTTAKLKVPYAVWFSKGSLFVTDNNNDEVRQVMPVTNSGNASDPNNWLVSTLAGTGGAGFASGAGNVATFSAPQGITMDASGNILVSDSTNNAVRKVVANNGNFPIGVATGSVGTEVPSLANATGIIPSTADGLNVPYISYPQAIGSGGASAAKPWNFVVPNGVTDFQFTVTVLADSSLSVPLAWATGAGSPDVMVRTFSGGRLGYQNGPPSIARFNGPEIMAVDQAGNIYAADAFNNAIRRVTPDGTAYTIANPTLAGGATDGSGLTAKFGNPQGIACSPDGTVVYVADTANDKIRRLAFQGGNINDPASWLVTTVAGTGTAGGNYSSLPGNTATLNFPVGIAMDAGGSLFITEFIGNRVRRMILNGGDASNAANWTVSLLAGDNSSVGGFAGSADSPSGIGARFNHPGNIALDLAGNAYIADTSNHRIRKVTVDGATTTVAGGTSGSAPTPGYQDGPAATALFNIPDGIAVDGAGDIYVGESADNHIRVITGGNVYTVAGTGVTGTTDGPGNVATFDNPAALAFSPSGTLYLGSTNDNSIRAIDRVVKVGSN